MTMTSVSPTIIQRQIHVLITKILKCTTEEIINFDLIYCGHSSIVFSFQISGDPQVYCLRWNLDKPQSSQTSTRWRNEYYYIHGSKWKDDYLYFDSDNGHYIKKKIPGDKLIGSMMTPDLWSKVVLALIEFQNQKIQFKNRFGFNPYNAYLNQACPLKDIDLELFIKIGDLNHGLPVVFAHNSLNLKNIIYGETGINFIDFEWVAHNNCYFDLASLIYDANSDDAEMKFLFDTYNKHSPKKLIWKTLQLFVYFAAALAYQWADYRLNDEFDADINFMKKRAFAAMTAYKKRFDLKKWLAKPK